MKLESFFGRGSFHTLDAMGAPSALPSSSSIVQEPTPGSWRMPPPHPSALVREGLLSPLSRPILTPQPVARPRTPSYLRDLGSDLTGVPYALIVAAQEKVPVLRDNIDVGPNSAARFATMLGRPLSDYKDFASRCPRPTFSLVWGGLIWLAPKVCSAITLQAHLCRQPELDGVNLSESVGYSFDEQEPTLLRSMRQGRPVLALLGAGVDAQWVNVIGQVRSSQNWIVMTGGARIFELEAGQAALGLQMDAHRALLRGLGNLPRFSAVSCTASAQPQGM